MKQESKKAGSAQSAPAAGTSVAATLARGALALVLLGIALTIAALRQAGMWMAKARPGRRTATNSADARRNEQIRQQAVMAAAARTNPVTEARRIGEGDFADTFPVTPLAKPAVEAQEASAPAGELTPQVVAASRVVTINIDAREGVEVGALWLYLYPGTGVVRRVLRLLNPSLVEAFKRHSFYLADKPWDGTQDGLQQVIDDSGEEVRRIVESGMRRYHEKRAAESAKADGDAAALEATVRAAVARKHLKRKDAAPTRELPAPAPAPRASVRTDSPPVPAPAPKVSAASEPVPHTPAVQAGTMRLGTEAEVQQRSGNTAAAPLAGWADRPVIGKEYVGHVAEMGEVFRTDRGGARYRTFGLTLESNGVHMPFYGAELERELSLRSVAAGDRISLVFMGKTNVGTEQVPMMKNLYKATLIERARKAAG